MNLVCPHCEGCPYIVIGEFEDGMRVGRCRKMPEVSDEDRLTGACRMRVQESLLPPEMQLDRDYWWRKPIPDKPPLGGL